MNRTKPLSDPCATTNGDCPHCGTGHVRRVGMFEHITCGFVDIADTFSGVGTTLDCPKCDETLSVADEQFRCISFIMCCADCERRFDTPDRFVFDTIQPAESE